MYLEGQVENNQPKGKVAIGGRWRVGGLRPCKRIWALSRTMEIRMPEPTSSLEKDQDSGNLGQLPELCYGNWVLGQDFALRFLQWWEIKLICIVKEFLSLIKHGCLECFVEENAKMLPKLSRSHAVIDQRCVIALICFRWKWVDQILGHIQSARSYKLEITNFKCFTIIVSGIAILELN